MNFWDAYQKATIIHELVANSVKSLEQITPSSELQKAGRKERKKHIIRIVINKHKKTLSIIDNGVGMTKGELEYYGSSLGGGRGLLVVADKVVITTKHFDENADEYVMELSPKELVVIKSE